MSAYDDYLTEAMAYWRAHPEQRKGQAFFNALASEHLGIAEPAWGEHWPGGRDPFYRDDNLPSFLEYVRGQFETEVPS